MEKINVAIADDNKDLVHMLEKYLTEEGMDVVGTAYNGKECLNMLEETVPDVLVLDIISHISMG